MGPRGFQIPPQNKKNVDKEENGPAIFHLGKHPMVKGRKRFDGKAEAKGKNRLRALDVVALPIEVDPAARKLLTTVGGFMELKWKLDHGDSNLVPLEVALGQVLFYFVGTGKERMLCAVADDEQIRLVWCIRNDSDLTKELALQLIVSQPAKFNTLDGVAMLQMLLDAWHDAMPPPPPPARSAHPDGEDENEGDEGEDSGEDDGAGAKHDDDESDGGWARDSDFESDENAPRKKQSKKKRKDKKSKPKKKGGASDDLPLSSFTLKSGIEVGLPQCEWHELGEGAFGRAYQATNPEGRRFAVKLTTRDEARHEWEILRTLAGEEGVPAVYSLYEQDTSMSDDDDDEEEEPAGLVVLEMAVGPSVKEVVEGKTTIAEKLDVLRACWGPMLTILDQLGRRRVWHGDVHLRHFLSTEPRLHPTTPRLMLIDWGGALRDNPVYTPGCAAPATPEGDKTRLVLSTLFALGVETPDDDVQGTRDWLELPETRSLITQHTGEFAPTLFAALPWD